MARWCELAGEKGYYTLVSSRLYKTALAQMASVLSDDDPRFADWVLEHLDELSARYANKKMPKQGTLRTYLGKARTLLEDFFEFQKDPVAFKPRGRTASESGGKARKGSAEVPAGDETPAQVPPDNSTTDRRISNAARMRDYPLADGRAIRFQLPDDGISFGEVKKFALHLLTIARDFDLEDQAQADVFAIVRHK